MPKRDVYFVLPFTGKHCLELRTRVFKLCSTAYPHLKINFVFRPTRRLSSFLQVKDQIPELLRSGVTYSFKCPCCGVGYLGKTIRQFHRRLSDHLGISSLTGKKLSTPPFSSIRSHSSQTAHSFSASNFDLIAQANSEFELLIKESLLISQLSPSLNVNQSSIPLSLF